MDPSPTAPLCRILVANHQDAVVFDLQRVQSALPRAFSGVAQEPSGPSGSLLASLPEIEVSVISDPEIARQHETFLGDASPTDVITFHHGELLLSADTALAESRSLGHPVERELLLYAVHGLLHLHGYDDRAAADRLCMQAIQERILSGIWPE